jgi:hypothetical protein
MNRDKKLSFGKRELDGTSKIFINDKEVCKMYVLSEDQVKEIEKIKLEINKSETK